MVDRRLPAPATGKNSASPILCFLRISDHLESICKIFFFRLKSSKNLAKFLEFLEGKILAPFFENMFPDHIY